MNLSKLWEIVWDREAWKTAVHGVAKSRTWLGDWSTTTILVGLNIYWAWLCPSEQDPVSPSISLSHQEASSSLLFFSIQGQTDWKPQSQPYLSQGNYEPCCVGPPKTGGSWWRVLTKPGPLEKGMAKNFSILALRTPWSLWKGKKIGYWKMDSPGWLVPNMLLRITGEITPEWMKRWNHSKQYPVVDVTGDGSKVRCCKEQYCIGTWNVRSMNQRKLEVVKQEMARVKVNILGISELKWTEMCEFNSDDLYLLLWARIP